MSIKSNKVYKTRYIQLTLSEDGSITSLISKGKDYLSKEKESLFITLSKAGKQKKAKLHIDENLIIASFPEENIEITFQVLPAEGYIAFKLLGVNTHNFEHIELGSLNVTITKTPACNINGCYDDKFLVTVMPLSIEVYSVFNGGESSFEYPGKYGAGWDGKHYPYPNMRFKREPYEHINLNVQCFPQFGLVGASFAILGCPTDKFLDIVDEMEIRFNLPRCVRSLRSESPRKSYLLISGGAKEENADAVIKYARKGAFGTIMIFPTKWAHPLGGHYDINRGNFPDGISGLKRLTDKFHKAGFEVGLHNFGAALCWDDDYIDYPSPYLAAQGIHALLEDIDEKTDTIPLITNCPETLLTSKIGDDDRSILPDDNAIRIGNEIIKFGRLEGPPYRLTGCKRGLKQEHIPTSHKKGEIVYHLKMIFGSSNGMYAVETGTPLEEEIAYRLAAVANFCKVDFTFSDYAERSQGWVNGGVPRCINEPQKGNWYYTAKFLLDFYKKIENPNLLFQTSYWTGGMGFSWHFSPRSHFMNGEKDIKKCINGRIGAPMEICDNFKIPDVGWLNLMDEDTNYYTPSDFEYMCKKAIGFNGMLSVHTTLDVLAKCPDTEEILTTIARYRKLQDENKFSEDEKEAFRKPQG